MVDYNKQSSEYFAHERGNDCCFVEYQQAQIAINQAKDRYSEETQYQTREMSWSEFEEAANRLANAMIDRGIKAGDKVAVRMHSRIEWFVVNKAISKIGAKQVAVSWYLTPSEFTYIVEDSGAEAIVFDDRETNSFIEAINPDQFSLIVSINELTGHNEASANVVEYQQLLASGSSKQIVAQAAAQLILYTSGTTGRPKGSVPDEKRIMNNLQEVMEYREDVAKRALSASSSKTPPKTLLTLPLHHGAGPMAAQGCSSLGGIVYILGKFQAETALSIISEHKITVWNSVPTMLHKVTSLPEQTMAKYDVSSLKSLSVGASPMPFTLKQKVIEFFGPCLSESYGMTEIGMTTLLEAAEQLERPGSCGKPFKHVYIRVLDEQGAELPAREVGEVWVKTPMVIDQYLNRDPLDSDTLTADRFFRTGDMGFIDEDGYLYITDRKKDMIIAGGVNIYPAEIEAALSKHPHIVEAAVIGIPHKEFGEQVLAFVERVPSATENTLSEQDVISLCETELSKNKHPRKVIFLDSLPRSPIGKVLKNTLREKFWQNEETKV